MLLKILSWGRIAGLHSLVAGQTQMILYNSICSESVHSHSKKFQMGVRTMDAWELQSMGTFVIYFQT